MTSTELAEIEAWKDDEIIKDIGIHFATTWGTSKRLATRQIYDNMMLEGLCPIVAAALLHGKDSVAPEFMSTHFDKVQTDNKLPRTALGMIKIPKTRNDSEWTETDRNHAAWKLYKSIMSNKMEQDSIWKVQWHESIATTLVSEEEEDPILQRNQIIEALTTLMPTVEQEPTVYVSTDEDNPDDASALPGGPYRIQLIAASGLILNMVNESTRKTPTEEPLEPDDVTDDFEDVIEDEQIIKAIPQSMRGIPFTRQVYAHSTTK